MAVKQAIQDVKWLLSDSEVTIYRIAKDTGILEPTLRKYSTGKSRVENMSAGNLAKLHDYYLKIKKEWIEMEKTIYELTGKEITLLELDNILQGIGVTNSIFDGDEQEWNFGNESAFAYHVNSKQYNVWFSIVNKSEDNLETIISVKGLEEI